MRNIKSMIFVLLAGCLWGCMGLLVRPLNLLGFQSMDIVAVRCFVTALLTLLTLPVLSKLNNSSAANDIRIRFKDIWIFIGTGVISVVFFNFCYFSTIIYTSLSVAAIMLYTAPIFVMLISAVVFRDKLSIQKIAALIMAFLGCAIVTGAITGNMTVSGIGMLYGLGAGIGYALYSIFGKLATDRGYTSVTVTLYTFAFASIGVIPFISLQRIVNAFSGNLRAVIYTFFMIILTTYLPYILYTAGLSAMEPGKAAILACVEPVMATLVGWVIYKETPRIMTVLGVIFVIFAIFLINFNKNVPKE